MTETLPIQGDDRKVHTVLVKESYIRAVTVWADGAGEAADIADDDYQYEQDKGVLVDGWWEIEGVMPGVSVTEASMGPTGQLPDDVPFIQTHSAHNAFTGEWEHFGGWTQGNPPAQEWRGEKKYATRSEAFQAIEDELATRATGESVPD